MSAKANYFKLGMFILIAVGLAIGAVLVFGASRVFERRYVLETYLDQSVQGIDVGSKVKYRGVTIGTVRRIGFTQNRYSQSASNLVRQSYVLLELELTSVPFGELDPDAIARDMPKEVQHGLRARLTAQGVTGTSYLEVDYLDPKRYPPLPIDWEPGHPYLPSAPSALAKIVSSAEDLLTELGSIDFKKLANRVDGLIDLFDRKLGEVPMATLSTNALTLLAEVRESNQRLQGLLDRPELTTGVKDLAGTAANLRRITEAPGLTNSVAQLERTLRRLDQFIAGKDHELQASLENLRSLTENLRELSENAKRFPAQVLFGEPPKPTRLTP